MENPQLADDKLQPSETNNETVPAGNIEAALETGTQVEQINIKSESPTDTGNEAAAEVLAATGQASGEPHADQPQHGANDTPEEQQSLTAIISEMDRIAARENPAADSRRFNQLKEQAHLIIRNESTDDAAHPLAEKYHILVNRYREKQDAYRAMSDAEAQKNLEHRQRIIEKLKNLYTNSEPGINLFKAIRDIKEEWTMAGQVPKQELKNINNNYFHHLNQFYAVLDMNKEYMELEHAHNLEKRQNIIARARELAEEPNVQKALNELQFLHKKWKEDAEPVAEEFRESTWDEFKELSNKIHDRKAELYGQIEEKQQANLEKKNKIIQEIGQLATPQNSTHSYWQQSIRRIEELRSEFLAAGAVPKLLSNQNWADFKEALRAFNSGKNEFYKNLKGTQQSNLDAKLQILQTAKDNMHSEDWETAVPLFKKLQDDWKSIGHIPRSMTNTLWDDFREACNVFFNNFRAKNNAANDNWKENYKKKAALLEELKEIGEEEGSAQKIEDIKSMWNAVGKVPREKLGINNDFNKVLREKLKLNRINDYEVKAKGSSESQVTDQARKIKNQIADLEAEIAKMENNLGFFGKVSRDNPLLQDTFRNIDIKKTEVESMKQALKSIITNEQL